MTPTGICTARVAAGSSALTDRCDSNDLREAPARAGAFPRAQNVNRNQHAKQIGEHHVTFFDEGACSALDRADDLWNGQAKKVLSNWNTKGVRDQPRTAKPSWQS